MKHLDEQEIAVMIEGGISKEERERYLEHLSECETCFSVYTETLRYVEEEEKEGKVSVFPAIGAAARRFVEGITAIVQSRPLRLAAVSLAVILVVVFVGVREQAGRKAEKAQLKHIEERFTGNDEGVYAFSPSKSKKVAAVKAGMLVEVLPIVVDADGEDELRTGVISLLNEELKTLLEGKSDSLLTEPETLIRMIRLQVDKQGFKELFEFGRFVELGILAAFEGETPKRSDIDKHLLTAGKPAYELPPGVLKTFGKLKEVSGVEEIKKVFLAVEEVLLIME